MTARTALIDRQLSWAAQAGYAPDSRAYLSALDYNLFQQLSTVAKSAFNRGSGSELLDTPTRPAKMKALHSSSALAVNVFDYWTTVDSSPLARAFADLVDAGLAFTAASYQELFARLQDGSTGEHATYLDYLHQRYFGTDD
jgi:hypothetical protein